MKRSLTGRSIIITGASSGIGRALAVAFAHCGAAPDRAPNRLVLTARRSERLAAVADEVRTAGGEVRTVVGDITDAELRSRLLDTATQEFGGLDLLINNAGIGGIGTFASADEERLRLIMEVNFFAPAELLRAALPLLRASDDGVVVNVGSVLGHCAVPKKSEYCASKFAMHGLNDSLRMELADEGVDVILANPSTTSSEFFDQAMRSDGKAAKNSNAMTPEEVAAKILLAVQRRKREVVLSFGGKALVWADRIAPGLVSLLLRKYG